VFFSDAIFAIAITLLALELIKIAPDTADLAEESSLIGALKGTAATAAGYLLSFAVVGIFWVDHNRKFALISRLDTRLLLLNLAMMMVIVIVPIPTALLISHRSQLTAALYSMWLAVTSLCSAGLWAYAAGGRRLLGPSARPRMVRGETIISLVLPAIFLASTFVSLLSVTAARVIWWGTLLSSLVVFCVRGGTETARKS